MIVLQWFKPAAPVGLQWLVPIQSFPAPLAPRMLKDIAVIAGSPGQSAADSIENPADITDYIAILDGSLN